MTSQLAEKLSRGFIPGTLFIKSMRGCSPGGTFLGFWVENRISFASCSVVLQDATQNKMSRALQLAEKILQRRNYREGLLQGLQPDADWIGFIGPTNIPQPALPSRVK
jgi:hypothetical protein